MTTINFRELTLKEKFTIAFEQNVLWFGVATLVSPFLPGIELLRLATPIGEQRVVAPDWMSEPIGVLPVLGMLSAIAVVIALLRRLTRHAGRDVHDVPDTWTYLVGTLVVSVGFALFGMPPIAIMLSWPLGGLLRVIAISFFSSDPFRDRFVPLLATMAYMIVGIQGYSLTAWTVSTVIGVMR